MALFGHKLCDICNKNRATVKLTRVDPGGVKELLICQSCASEYSPLHRKSEEIGPGFQALFSSLLNKSGEEAAAPAETEGAACSVCGLPFETYRKTFLLGCASCYDSFADALLADLRKIHGETRHLGKCPQGQSKEIKDQVAIAALRQQLGDAVAREDFEAAARLRDQIRDLEQGQA
jgi:protein arginine kinase activator